MKNILYPLEKQMRQEGTDLTIITWEEQVFHTMTAAKQLEAKGHSVEVIDLRSIRPLDQDVFLIPVAKPGRCLVTHQRSFVCWGGSRKLCLESNKVALIICRLPYCVSPTEMFHNPMQPS